MFKLINFKAMVPYFLLAVAVIIAYYAISEVNTIISFISGIFSKIWSVIRPFVYGFIIAYILHMPFESLKKLMDKSKFNFIRKRKKAISLVLIIILLILIIFTISSLIIPAVYDSLFLFIENLPRYWQEAQSWLEDLSKLEIFNLNSPDVPDIEIPGEDMTDSEVADDSLEIPEPEDDVNGLEIYNGEFNNDINDSEAAGFHISLESIIAMLSEWLYEFSFDNFSSALFGVGTAIVGVGSAIFTGFLALISSIYFLIEKDKIKYFLCRLLVIFTPPKFHDNVIKYGGELDHNCKQYIKIQTIDGLILGTLATVALFFMAPDFALLLGIMLGIVNYIPYFGSIFGTLVAVVIVAFTQGIPRGLLTLAVLLVIQQCDANIIQPKLMGGSFKLSPLLVIISITIGGAMAGIFGMIIAIPIVKVLAGIFEDIVKNFEQEKLKKAVAGENKKEE